MRAVNAVVDFFGMALAAFLLLLPSFLLLATVFIVASVLVRFI